MKSPNAKLSMKLLNTAEQALRNAWEDLKNDPEVRKMLVMKNDSSILERMQRLERELKQVQETLKGLGY